MEEEDCALVCYLIAEDNPNYEFLDDDNDIHIGVSHGCREFLPWLNTSETICPQRTC